MFSRNNQTKCSELGTRQYCRDNVTKNCCFLHYSICLFSLCLHIFLIFSCHCMKISYVVSLSLSLGKKLDACPALPNIILNSWMGEVAEGCILFAGEFAGFPGGEFYPIRGRRGNRKLGDSILFSLR